MDNRQRTLIIVFALVVVLVIVFSSRGITDRTRAETPVDESIGTAVGETAPDLVLSTLDSGEIRLSDYRGRIVLVNDFASWCGPCRIETPELVAHQDANREDITLIGLNIGEDQAAVEAYRDDFLVNYPLVLDLDDRAAEYFRPRGLPTSWFIDARGVVRYIHSGPMTIDMIEKVLVDIQAGRQPDPFGF